MAKVLVFGTGGVGGVYTWILERAGAKVTAVCRTNYKQVKEHGISINSKLWGQIHSRPSAVSTASEAAQQKLGPFDYVFVTSKAMPGTSEKITDAVSAETAIVVAQNGIGIEEEYKVRFPRNTIISGVVYLPTTQVRPGFIEMGSFDILHVGLYRSPFKQSSSSNHGDEGFSDGKTTQQTQLNNFVALFRKGGGTCNIYEDVQIQRWIKLAVNACWNPICALTRCDDANYLRSFGEPPSDFWPPDPTAYRSLSEVRAVMQEVAEIATAAGYPNVVTNEMLRKWNEGSHGRLKTGGIEPSMLTDVRFNRELEVEGILGNAVRIAEQLGLGERIPRLKLLYVLAKGLNYSIAPDERWRPIAPP